MTEPALIARHLKVERGGKPVLDDVSFEVAPGQVYALLGGNGAGKSTTLLTFLGFLKPESGEALIHGKSPSTHANEVRAQVAYLPENAALYEHLTARENIEYFLALSNLERSAEQIETTLNTVDLATSRRADKLGNYSKGMRQKTAIALALLRDTPVLLLDEPTSGLDPVAVDDFHQLVDRLSARGVSILMVTHDLYGACQVAARVGLLRRGRLVGTFAAKPDEPIDTQAVRELFAEGATA